MPVGRKLKGLRVENDVCLKDLAAELGVSRQTLINWEKEPDLDDARTARYLFALTRLTGHDFTTAGSHPTAPNE